MYTKLPCLQPLHIGGFWQDSVIEIRLSTEKEKKRKNIAEK